MADRKHQTDQPWAEKGHKPVPRHNTGDSAVSTDHGYQPDKGNLDVTNPPKGGSGVPKCPAGEASSEKKG